MPAGFAEEIDYKTPVTWIKVASLTVFFGPSTPWSSLWVNMFHPA
jgi:hypothetical protein